MRQPRVSIRWRMDGERAEAGSIAIVVDVLRASTTITTAFARGAAEILVTREVDEAFAMAREGESLLIGERGSVKIEGFDSCSSPSELDGQDLTDRRIVFTSTNFPHALHAAGEAGQILVGAVVNVTAVADRAADLAEHRGADICIMLAGEPIEAHALEDYYFAGLAAARLADRCTLDEDARRAADDVRALAPSEVAQRSKHAAELSQLGMGRDVQFALTRDRFEVVAERRGGVLRRA
ncbi:MAG: 2-phosphosulfolactate phosphatase [Planctomycetota bacterium]|nr:2-phosphosulfolactate phosphatase [Planctomycetota bacterium]